MAIRYHTENMFQSWSVAPQSKNIWEYLGPGYPQIYAELSTLRMRRRRYLLATTGQSSDGWRDPTPYGSYKVTCRLSPYNYRVRVANGQYWQRSGPYHHYPETRMWAGFHHASMHIPGAGFTSVYRPIVNQDIKDRAYTEALTKVAQRKLTLTTEVAELGKSIDTLVERFRKLVAALILIKRGKFKQAWQTFGVRSYRSAGETWLEWQYGWKPLISSIDDALKLVDRGFDERPTFHVTRTVRSPFHMPGYKYFRGEMGCKVRFDFQVNDVRPRRASQLGINDSSVIETGWELLPFSFVVDWIVPVGNFIQALGATNGLRYKGGSSTHWTRTRIIDSWFINAADQVLMSGELPSCTVDAFAVVRDTVISKPILPAIYVKWPFTSASRIASALSLLSVLSPTSTRTPLTPSVKEMIRREHLLVTNRYRDRKFRRERDRAKRQR